MSDNAGERHSFTRDQWIVASALMLASALAWLSLISMEMDGDTAAMGDMGASAIEWTSGYAIMVFAMWSIMMVAMMLPPAMPMILLYTRIASQARSGGGTLAPVFVFTGVYVALWAAFSAVATLAQWQLSEAGLVSGAMMALGDGRVAGGLLIAAGLYQLTPFKKACLQNCRSPVAFLTSHWRPGYGGAVRLGLAHGLYCLGCCWLIMMLLFAGGVMNLVWVAVLAAIVSIEKVAPFGERAGQVAGIAAFGTGVAMMSGYI
jgi:predicted metal-binding membrane protein